MTIDDFNPESPDALIRRFAGTYKSNWYFLVNAAQACLLAAANSLKELVDGYAAVTGRGDPPGETRIKVGLTYQLQIGGPLLGTILIASAALEAFLRTLKRSQTEKGVPRRLRAGGTGRKVVDAMADFDSLDAGPKLNDVYRAVIRAECPLALEGEFGALFAFRNRCFHSDPTVILRSGEDQTTRHGRKGSRVVLVPEALESAYPHLADGTFGLAPDRRTPQMWA